ncbi:MAG: DNA (cytosine-5-)-methyltransferase [Chloroflexi bacterium]|nr:DNA (cytosine-5-)-methyltransferase [Chloroflexota bacterium]
MKWLTSLEICAGGGGTAVGTEQAGFHHVGLVEVDSDACRTLRMNHPDWNVIETDVRNFEASAFEGVDLLSGGVPCPPFSMAGLRLGRDDDRDLFPHALRIIGESRPRAVLLENVRGLLEAKFADYRAWIDERLSAMGYVPEWRLLNARDFGVPQLRPRAVCVGLRPEDFEHFSWPSPLADSPLTVGEALLDEMGSRGWSGAVEWASRAKRIAPTLVGGSKRHGGPDLGPTRARAQWAELGVNGKTIAETPPDPDHQGMPRLTVKMAARLQGFPPEWTFTGGKTAAYRQVGNAFPPPVAQAVAFAIRRAIEATEATSHDPHAVGVLSAS